MNALIAKAGSAGFSFAQYLTCLNGIVWREGLRFVHQRERFVAALVRPLVWLFIFAAGFRQVLGISIIPPYETYILYEVYITPGLAVMIQLFNGMQSSLSMVYDREVGSMRVLLTSPFPRWFLLLGKLVGGVGVVAQLLAVGLPATQLVRLGVVEADLRDAFARKRHGEADQLALHVGRDIERHRLGVVQGYRERRAVR